MPVMTKGKEIMHVYQFSLSYFDKKDDVAGYL